MAVSGKALISHFIASVVGFHPLSANFIELCRFSFFSESVRGPMSVLAFSTSVHMTPNLPVASTSGISSKDSFQNEQQTVKLNSLGNRNILLFVNNTTLGPCRSSWGGGGGRRWGEGRRRWQGGEMTCRSVSSTLRRTQRSA